MEALMLVVFVLGYLAIAFEHNIKVDKAPTALLIGMICWALYVFSGVDIHIMEHGADGNGGLYHHLFDVASILLFLLGAMTIVEVVDAHNGFSIITNMIKTDSKIKLLWIISIITFFLSSVLDNLTTAIVMISLLRKLVDDKQTRWFFAGMVIIAANAGGAWSPIGDVTTTMLWIKGQLPDVLGMTTSLFLPSIMTVVAPLAILSFTMKGKIHKPEHKSEHNSDELSGREKNIVFALGIGGLLFVPIFKTITHLPPFMGMMFVLAIVWIAAELLHKNKSPESRSKFAVLNIIRKIDTPSVLFFLGILMAVAALQEVGHLTKMAEFLDENIGNIYAINVAIGFLSSIIDNVPLVAAAQGMYSIAPAGDFAAGGTFWELLAYCAGTGGSCLIIGSAAGVAVMGLEKIDFMWYLKKVTLLATVGYLAGAGVYILTNL